MRTEAAQRSTRIKKGEKASKEPQTRLLRPARADSLSFLPLFFPSLHLSVHLLSCLSSHEFAFERKSSAGESEEEKRRAETNRLVSHEGITFSQRIVRGSLVSRRFSRVTDQLFVFVVVASLPLKNFALTTLDSARVTWRVPQTAESDTDSQTDTKIALVSRQAK